MSTGAAEALLQEVFGLPLLAYLCAANEADIQARVSGAGALSPAAEAVLLGQLLPLAQRAATTAAERPGFPVALELELLGRHLEQADTSVGNAYRIAAGGALPTVAEKTDDELGRALVRMAVHQYPVLLIPGEPWQPRAMMIGLYQHPERERVASLVVSDPDLACLFPDEDENLGSGGIGMVYSSLGSGGTLQSALFASTVIRSAWDATAMSVPNPSVDDLADQVMEHLDIARRTARGDVAHLRALVAFTGFTTEDAVPITTPWGLLRPLTERERQLAPAHLQGAVSGTGPDGVAVTVSYAGEMVLDSLVPYSVKVERHAPQDAASFPTVAGAGQLALRIEAIQLAGLLAVNRPPGSDLIVRVAWTQVSNPLGPGPTIGWSDTRAQPAFMPHQLSRDEAEALGHWCGLVATRRTPNIAIAIRRVISAAHVRTAPADRLVDAVIAWENLFGTTQGEVTLRVSSAMAWLLQGADASAREAVHKRLSRLYARRSKIVHGATVDERTLADEGNEAFRFAIEALAALLRDRPDLLARDGASRSVALLLNATRTDDASP